MGKEGAGGEHLRRILERIWDAHEEHTGKTVVSRWPQSRTRPVMRPAASSANTWLGANDSEGTFGIQLVKLNTLGNSFLTCKFWNSTLANMFFTQSGSNGCSTTTTLRAFGSTSSLLPHDKPTTSLNTFSSSISWYRHSPVKHPPQPFLNPLFN